MQPGTATPSAGIPADFAKPSHQYKRQAWLAVLSLLAFMLLYLGLAAWFLYTGYRVGSGMVLGRFDLIGFVVSGCALFLGAFMIKALFTMRKGTVEHAIEIKAAEQPRLFEFLNEIAASVGAPKPHRVFISPSVNACVFYDLSIFNLFWPSKKNLEIGLGLVNVLTLGELRAVLAHEFGHFAQRAMAVGRWTYTAQQVAGNVVAGRDAFDTFLQGLSVMDFRIAWVGWVLRLIVWSIRSLVETLFSGVLILQRSLSREMEFQADLVSVSLTGSDALIHALHKLQAADDAWGRSLDFAVGELARKKQVEDIFTVQSLVQQSMGQLLNEPYYGRTPPVPADRPEAHRLFKAELGQPPRMWLTHPLNHEREANAKQHYIAKTIDERSAWEIFDRADTLRKNTTLKLLGNAEDVVPAQDEILEKLRSQFAREHLKPRYRGVYFGRSIAHHVESPDALYDSPAALTAEPDFYPESLSLNMDQWRSLIRESDQLKAINDGYLTAKDGQIAYRGNKLKRNELPRVIAGLDGEIAEQENILRQHDKLCRTWHLKLATEVGQGWPEYLRGLLALHHFATHAEANIQDAAGVLRNVIHIETATRKVSDAGLRRLVLAASMVYESIKTVYDTAGEVRLDSALAKRLEVATWAEATGNLGLNPPAKEYLGEWLNIVDSWVGSTLNMLSLLRTHSLEQMLATESALSTLVKHGADIKPAEAPSAAPAAYPRLLPGKERPRPTKLSWWARFQNADGMPAMVARFAVAASIAVAVLTFGGIAGHSTVVIHNGLARPVKIKFGDQQIAVDAFGKGQLEVATDKSYVVMTTTNTGEVIEKFDAKVEGAYAHQLYNVAGASPVVKWWAAYGQVAAPPDQMLGNPRWSNVQADHFFSDPPQSISSKSGGGTRSVITAVVNLSPMRVPDFVEDEKSRQAMALAHARWDNAQGEHTPFWLGIASERPEFPALIKARLAANPKELVTLRAEQDAAKGAAREAICARHTQAAQATPEDADYAYLATRCLVDLAVRDDGFLSGHRKWPQHGWFAFAAGATHAQNSRWNEALAAYQVTLKNAPGAREMAALDSARILRLKGAASPKNMEVLAPGSIRLARLLAVEQPDEKAPVSVRAYPQLARGNLTEALKMSTDEGARKNMVLLTGFSDGSTPAMQAQAAALLAKEGPNAAPLGIGLAMFLKQDKPELALELVEKHVQERNREQIRTLISHLHRQDPPQVVEGKINGLDLEIRGQVYVAGILHYGNKAPATWRRDAKAILFAAERPFFQ